MERSLVDPDKLSKPELISLYINGYSTLDADQRSRFEAAFRKRNLPLPSLSDAVPEPARGAAIDKKCFMSYILLLYTGTAIFYSWIYLAKRLIKMDFRENTRHKLIQSGIALFYIAAEVLLYLHFAGLV